MTPRLTLASPSRPRDFIELALAATVFLTIFVAQLVFFPSGVQPPLSGVATHLHGAARALNIHDRIALPKYLWSGLGAASTFVLLALWSRRSVATSRLSRLWCSALPLSMALAATAVVAASGSLRDAVETLRPFIPYVGAVALFWATVHCEAARRAAVQAVLAAAVAVAACVALQEWGVPMPTTDAPWISPPAVTFTHRNLAGLVILAGLPLGIVGYLTQPARLKRAAYVVFLVLLTAGLVGTRSRTCIVAGLGGLACALLWCRPARPVPRSRYALLALAAAGGIALHSASPMADDHFSLSTKLSSLVQTLHHPLASSPGSAASRAHSPASATGGAALASVVAESARGSAEVDAGLLDRIALWRFCLLRIADHPWLGIGLGQFRDVARSAAGGSPRAQPHAHNAWLQIAVELGFPMLLIAMIATALVGAAAYRLLRARAFQPAYVYGAAAGAVALLLASLLEAVVPDTGPNLLAAALMGCLLGWGDSPPLEQRSLARTRAPTPAEGLYACA